MVRNLAIGFFAISLTTGCTLGPDYSRPKINLAEQYSQSTIAGQSIANLPWWELFSDPVLKDLIRIALQENKDLKIALARINEARAILGFTRADQFPRIDVGGTANRGEASKEAVVTSPGLTNDFSVFGDLSFEVDIWGRYSRATEAERAQLLASESSYRSVTITLVSTVAQTYFTLRAIDDELAIAEFTLKNRAGATKVIDARYQKGVVPLLDLNQAQIEESDSAVSIASFQRQGVQAENALRRLLGRTSYKIPRGDALASQILPTELPTGLPAALLERRPDVLAAEQLLQSETARIGIAVADRLPRLRLLGSIGVQSEDTGNLFSSNARTWAIGGDLLGPLLDFGKSRSRVDIAKARTEQALAAYEQSVIIAVQEVEDSLIAIQTYKQEVAQRAKQVHAAASATRLSRARYDQGVTSYLEVLDVERSLFNAQIGQAKAQEQYLSAIVQLYKAVGGGWSEQQAPITP